MGSESGVLGGFWISYAAIVQPTFEIAGSFAPASDASNGITAAAAGAATVGYNSGLGMYFLVWGIMCAIYFVASLRTYVVPYIFFTLRCLRGHATQERALRDSISVYAGSFAGSFQLTDVTNSEALIFAFEIIAAAYCESADRLGYD